MTQEESVTKDLLEQIWKKCTKPDEFFKDCWKQPAVYIPADGYERDFFFLEGDEIIFRDKKGGYIWKTKGAGQIALPAGVSISAKNVKMKSG